MPWHRLRSVSPHSPAQKRTRARTAPPGDLLRQQNKGGCRRGQHRDGDVHTATSFIDIRALEYSGLDPINPFDVGASASGDSASANSGSVTTTAASELIFGAGMTGGGFSGAGANFTTRIITSIADIAEDLFVRTPGSYSATAPTSLSRRSCRSRHSRL